VAVELDVAHPVVLGPGEGEALADRPGQPPRLKYGRDELAAIEFLFPRGTEIGLHIHRRKCDSFYVLEGELLFELADDSVPAPAGSFLLAPPGLVHGLSNPDSDVRALNVHAPSCGFHEQMRARRDGQEVDYDLYDVFDPPEDGGRDPADAVVVGPGEGQRLEGEQCGLLVKVERPELDVLEYDVGPGYEGPGPYYHERHVDSFYVLDGELELTLEGETVHAGAGTWVSAPPRVVHAFTNPGQARARFLNLHVPARGFVEYLRARARGEDVDPARFDIYEV
jgi:quercetin dioxygenase-like cupin family protein